MPEPWLEAEALVRGIYAIATNARPQRGEARLARDAEPENEDEQTRHCLE